MEVGEIGLPLSIVTKIQRRGIQPLGIVFIVVGLLALFVGAALNVWDKGVDLLTSPVGIEQKKHPGTPMLIFGGAIFLAGLFFFRYPPVNYPKQEWELRTDAPQLKQNIP